MDLVLGAKKKDLLNGTSNIEIQMCNIGNSQKPRLL
jgi:hypothetical protein